MVLQHSVAPVIVTSVLCLFVPISLMGQVSRNAQFKSEWVPRPKIFQVQSAIEASKKDALRARGTVREEYLGILSDVEEAINTARNAANRRHQQEVINRLKELGPALQEDSRTVQTHRQSALNDLRKSDYRQGDQMPSKPSRFMRKQSGAVKRITPPEMSFDPRRSPVEVMARTDNAEFRKNITLNPIRWFWKRSKKPELISGAPPPKKDYDSKIRGVYSNAPSARAESIQPVTTTTAPASPSVPPEPVTEVPPVSNPLPISQPPPIESVPPKPVPAPVITSPLDPIDILTIDPPVPPTPLEDPVPTLPPLDPVKDILEPPPPIEKPPVTPDPAPIYKPIPEVEIPDLPIPDPVDPIPAVTESPEIATEYQKEFDAYSQRIEERELQILNSLQELNEILDKVEMESRDSTSPTTEESGDSIEDLLNDLNEAVERVEEFKTDESTSVDSEPIEDAIISPDNIEETSTETKAPPSPSESKVKPKSKFKTRSHRLTPR